MTCRYLETMNEAQRAAATCGDGPMLVLAGPGSGKTHTIIGRIFYLIEQKKVPPGQILVITFTRDAAQSMQNRFFRQAGETLPVAFGTFHSVFYQILRQSQSTRFPGVHESDILTGKQKKALLEPILMPFIGRLSENDRRRIKEDLEAALGAISYYKNTEDEKGAAGRLPDWIPEREKRFPEIFRRYEEARKRINALDFDDMVYSCRELLQSDEAVRRKWQNRFSHLLIDEFQDINPLQYQVVGLLAKPPYNLFAVGDDDQAIYGFRGADPTLLRRFEREYHAGRMLLDVNYRCHPDIIQASQDVIRSNRNRYEKRLLPDPAKKGREGEAAVRIRSYPEQADCYRELALSLRRIPPAENAAVLFRTNARMQACAVSLRREGIAFSMKEKVTSIYRHFVVQDVMAYLRLARGESSRELLLQIMNKPNRFLQREAFGGAGMRTLSELKAYYAGHYDALYRERAVRETGKLERQLDALGKLSLPLAVSFVARAVGYEGYLKKLAGSNRERLEEWLGVLEWLAEDAARYPELKEWLAAQEEYEESLGEEKRTGEDDARIRLMTVHGSKGLEFDHVFLPDCNEKIYPHESPDGEETCEEERRIFYVAMTRAGKTLELSFLTGGKERPRVMSRFLNPLLERYGQSPFNSSYSH